MVYFICYLLIEIDLQCGVSAAFHIIKLDKQGGKEK